jgi:NADPH:quinone reductase-like Zn-dependent oxidoreductase
LNEKGIFLSTWDSATVKVGDLALIKGLIEAGAIKAVIDRTYPIEEIVEAHRYVEVGHKKGNVVITITHNNKARSL